MSRESSPPQIAKRRRRRKAAASRVVATGLGAGALFGIVGSIGAHSSLGATVKAKPTPLAARASAATPRPGITTPTTIVWRVVHRVVVVTDPPLRSSYAGSGGGTQRTYAPARNNVSAPSAAPVAAPASSPAPAPAPVAAPAPPPAPAPAPPACSGSKCP